MQALPAVLDIHDEKQPLKTEKNQILNLIYLGFLFLHQ